MDKMISSDDDLKYVTQHAGTVCSLFSLKREAFNYFSKISDFLKCFIPVTFADTMPYFSAQSAADCFPGFNNNCWSPACLFEFKFSFRLSKQAKI